jgi:hypothetical protein
MTAGDALGFGKHDRMLQQHSLKKIVEMRVCVG